jgi:hypothetical protein
MHSTIIEAWKSGSTIQYSVGKDWFDVKGDTIPLGKETQLRVKPSEKPPQIEYEQNVCIYGPGPGGGPQPYILQLRIGATADGINSVRIMGVES